MFLRTGTAGAKARQVRENELAAGTENGPFWGEPGWCWTQGWGQALSLVLMPCWGVRDPVQAPLPHSSPHAFGEEGVPTLLPLRAQPRPSTNWGSVSLALVGPQSPDSTSYFKPGVLLKVTHSTTK